MNDDEKMQELRKRCLVHRMPSGIQPVHRNYGLWILHGGIYTAPKGGFYNTPPRYFEYFSISHMHEGNGRLWLPPDKEYQMNPGNCVIISPGTINRYGGAEDCYVEDSICFAGPVADMLYNSGVIANGVFEMGKVRRLRLIMELAADPAVNSQLNANFALQRLLFDIYNANTSFSEDSNQIIDKLLETMKEQIRRWWTVEEMAEFCSLSSDQLRRVFEKRTGMLPKIYLDRLKLQKAAELLISTKNSVADIASELGYVDPYHFSRRFKAITGFPPKQYRREFASRI